jgi:hypothetical protein
MDRHSELEGEHRRKNTEFTEHSHTNTAAAWNLTKKCKDIFGDIMTAVMSMRTGNTNKNIQWEKM